MRNLIREFAAICSRTLPIADPVYEFGAFQVPGQERIADLRPLFAGKTYIGADCRPGKGVDAILDLHRIDLADGSVGTLLCFDTLEHVQFPHKALEEMHRVLRPGGVLAMSSVMKFPIHDYPHDYWRFTPEGFRSLLQPFLVAIVESTGDERFPHTVVGIGIREGGPSVDLGEFRRRLSAWKTSWSRPRALWGWRDWVSYLLPPVIVDGARKLAFGLRRID